MALGPADGFRPRRAVNAVADYAASPTSQYDGNELSTIGVGLERAPTDIKRMDRAKEFLYSLLLQDVPWHEEQYSAVEWGLPFLLR